MITQEKLIENHYRNNHITNKQYAVLRSYVKGKQDGISNTLTAIGKRVGISRATVVTHLKNLSELGVITYSTTKGSKGGASIRIMKCPKDGSLIQRIHELREKHAKQLAKQADIEFIPRDSGMEFSGTKEQRIWLLANYRMHRFNRGYVAAKLKTNRYWVCRWAIELGLDMKTTPENAERIQAYIEEDEEDWEEDE